MQVISFDESGNTGPDLLNAEQPIFVLASCDFSEDEATKLVDLVRSPQAQEAKFANLRRSKAGQRKIINLLTECSKNPERIMVSIFHKRYMITTKIVDIILETLFYGIGVDIYKNGMNLALSNLHYYCLDCFCGSENVDALYLSFVEMIRNTDEANINTFYDHLHQVYAASTNQNYKKDLEILVESRPVINDILQGVDSSGLDPALSAFYFQCAKWGERTKNRFDTLHDDSKSLYKDRETLESFMRTDIPYEEIGYDRRKYTFPLKAKRVNFGDSKNYARLQVTDIIASSASHFSKNMVNGKNDKDGFAKQLEKAGIENFTANLVWPFPEVTPAALGTEGEDGVNPVDYMMNL